MLTVRRYQDNREEATWWLHQGSHQSHLAVNGEVDEDELLLDVSFVRLWMKNSETHQISTFYITVWRENNSLKIALYIN